MCIDLFGTFFWERACRYMFRKRKNPLISLKYPSDKVLKEAQKRELVRRRKEKAKNKMPGMWATLKENFSVAQQAASAKQARQRVIQ